MPYVDFVHPLTQRLRTHMIPSRVGIDLTVRCNLRCVHCYLTCHEIHEACKETELSTEEVRVVLEELSGAGTLMVEFSGGEPLLRADLLTILSIARHLGFFTVVSSNGTLLDVDIIRQLKRLGVKLLISIHGSTAETHDRIAGQEGAFAQTMRGISMCKRESVTVGLRATVMRWNAHEVSSISAMANELCVEYGFACYILPNLSKSGGIDSIRLTDAQLEQVGPGILRTWHKRPEVACGAARTSAWIGSTGDVSPCALMRRRCGNVRERKFIDIWRDSDALKEIRGITEGDMGKCLRCNIFDRCSPCIAANVGDTGVLVSPSPEYCRINRLGICRMTGSGQPLT